MVLTDEELNAARRAHEKARESTLFGTVLRAVLAGCDPPPHRGSYRNPAAPLPSATSQGAESGADLGEPATDNLSWLDKPAAPSSDNVRGNASTAPATAPTAAASYEVPAPGNAHAAPSAPQAAPAADDHFVIPTPAGDAAGSEPILTAATALSMQKSRYSRMHLLPYSLGWLITISLMDGTVGYPVVADPDRSERVHRVRLGGLPTLQRRVERRAGRGGVECAHFLRLPGGRLRCGTHGTIRRR